MNPWKLRQARRVVQSGGILAYPTEAVYGLGCDPLNEAAVLRILQLKRRPVDKGVILVAAELEQILDFVEFRDAAMAERVTATWPGPITWLIPASAATPAWIRGSHTTVAVRVSRHPVVQSLCRAAGPLVSTSANPAHYAPARSAHRVIQYFGHSVDYIVHGAPDPGRRMPSEIRDAETGAVIRGAG